MSIDPRRYLVGPDSTITDVDLDEEDVRLRDGRRLTNQLAEKMTREGVAEARRRNLIPGGKSLAGDGSHSPRVQFRVPESLRAAAEAKATAEGVSLSVLAREALEHSWPLDVGSGLQRLICTEAATRWGCCPN